VVARVFLSANPSVYAPIDQPLAHGGREKKMIQAHPLVYELRKGTVHFPLTKPVPVKLISRIAKLRAAGMSQRRKSRHSARGKRGAGRDDRRYGPPAPHSPLEGSNLPDTVFAGKRLHDCASATRTATWITSGWTTSPMER
jgi:hypothetical protein